MALPTLLVLAVLGTIYFGIATPTEAAAVGCVGALFSAAVYRRLNLDLVIQSTYTTATVTCRILWITIGARCFLSVFTAIEGGDLVTHFVTGLGPGLEHLTRSISLLDLLVTLSSLLVRFFLSEAFSFRLLLAAFWGRLIFFLHLPHS